MTLLLHAATALAPLPGLPERPGSQGQKSRHPAMVRMADHGYVHAGHAQSRDAAICVPAAVLVRLPARHGD